MDFVSSFAIPVAFDLSSTASDSIYRVGEGSAEVMSEAPRLVETQRDLAVQATVQTWSSPQPHRVVRIDE